MSGPTFVDPGLEEVYHFLRQDHAGFYYPKGAQAYILDAQPPTPISAEQLGSWKQGHDDAERDERFQRMREIAQAFRLKSTS